MNVEVLVAAMNQNDHSLLKKMNVNSNVIVGNQCLKNEIEEFVYIRHNIKYLSFCECGVGVNRNNALLRAAGDYLLISDEDVVLVDGYSDIIKQAFTTIPEADIIIFNIDTVGAEVHRRCENIIKRINITNFQNYGAVRIACKRSSISYANIWFSTLFGGGAKYSSGEDTLFLREALKKGLKIYTFPKVIATVYQNESTWFKGYNEKFFFDKGVLIASMFPIFKYCLAIVYYAIRYSNISKKNYFHILKWLFRGIHGFKKKADFSI